ncbi:DUF6282 family protein [Novosphingobium pentaromativorans]|uniref:Amidohydrolase-related domain-containing protein n=1 Tax=Novosphingobium pentaromativorans US6-1 TaxID=1088721 RepID=G6EGG5_9SPHN|nr:DUF6282 family protein [Novosphingobium pentaromativorans]EHJ59616.1 hypothetical protein NSU_3499 [Novosphingobium pentaromativorans US6-1]
MGHVRFEGAVDLHCHFGPDFINPIVSPSVTAIEAARDAVAHDMGAIVLKAHDFPTPQLAAAVQEAVPGLCTCGGIVLDYQVGGINAYAAEQALKLGAKIVWLPTVSSHQDHLNGIGPMLGYEGTGQLAIDDSGELTSVVKDIVELVDKYDAAIATGHTTPQEHYALARYYGKRGKVIVTHAMEKGGGAHLDEQQSVELAELGATIELCAQICVAHMGHQPVPVEDVARIVQRVGYDKVLLSSDFGWNDDLPRPAAGLRDFLDSLWEMGVSEEALRTMAVRNGSRILNLM